MCNSFNPQPVRPAPNGQKYGDGQHGQVGMKNPHILPGDSTIPLYLILTDIFIARDNRKLHSGKAMVSRWFFQGLIYQPIEVRDRYHLLDRTSRTARIHLLRSGWWQQCRAASSERFFLARTEWRPGSIWVHLGPSGQKCASPWPPGWSMAFVFGCPCWLEMTSAQLQYIKWCPHLRRGEAERSAINAGRFSSLPIMWWVKVSRNGPCSMS